MRSRNPGRKCCANCQNLRTEHTDTGVIPVCALDMKKFPERTAIDIANDVDINTIKCEEFEYHDGGQEL